MLVPQTNLIPKLFIGIDLHKKTWYHTIRTEIAEHKTFSTPSDPENIYNYVLDNFKGYDVHVCYEASCCGFTAARYLLNLGWKVTVINPLDIPQPQKQLTRKTDKIDSKNLCKQLMANTLQGINIPTEVEEQFRSLLRQRVSIVKDLRAIKNQIKGFLLYHGIKIPQEHDNNNWTNTFKKWLSGLKFVDQCGYDSMASKIRKLNFIYSEYQSLANQLRAYSRKNHKKDYELLKSIPGIGGYLSAAILAEAGKLTRFNNEAQFASFLGLVPGMFNSGGQVKNLGLTSRANHILRAYFIEAAWVAIRKDPEIQNYYKKFVGKNTKAVIIKVAHKMARRVLSVIKTQTPYRINNALSFDPKIEIPEGIAEIIEEQEEIEVLEIEIIKKEEEQKLPTPSECK